MNVAIARDPRWTGTRLTTAGALSLAVGGFVHLCLYRHGYRSIPDIGALFAANVVASAAMAAALLVRRDLLVRLAGIAVAAGTLAAFAVSRTGGGLLHFREIGLLPSPQAGIALAAELAAFVILGITIAWDLTERAGRLLGAAALFGVAAVHVVDLPAQVYGAGYITAGYLALIVTAIVLAVRLVRGPAGAREWQWAALVSAVAVLAYLISRAVGLPLDTQDVGNWAEPLGIAALLTEASVILIAVGRRSPRGHRPHGVAAPIAVADVSHASPVAAG